MKNKKVKLRLTITVEYTADPKWYDTTDPNEMAKIDANNFNDNLEDLIEILDSEPKPSIFVTPV